MKYCKNCGRTATIWPCEEVVVLGGDTELAIVYFVDYCPRCGSGAIEELEDQLVDWEFQGMMERAFPPQDRAFLDPE